MENIIEIKTLLVAQRIPSGNAVTPRKEKTMPKKYKIKVEISVYEITDDCDDIIRLHVSATSTDEKASIKFANDVHDSARKLLNERMK